MVGGDREGVDGIPSASHYPAGGAEIPLLLAKKEAAVRWAGHPVGPRILGTVAPGVIWELISSVCLSLRKAREHWVRTQ